MDDPPSTTAASTRVIGVNDQSDVAVDVDRWCRLARDLLGAEGARGELSLTFVTRDEMASLNREHMGVDGPTDVLSFPLDDSDDLTGVPVLLGDVVVCPSVAVDQAPEHAGTLDDELALLVVHGVLHVLGHDHATSVDTDRMRARERELLERHHWRGSPPPNFHQDHRDVEGRV